MRLSFIVTVASVVAFQAASPDSKHERWRPPPILLSSLPVLCEVVDPEIRSETMTLSSSGQFLPHYVTTIDDIEFSLGLDSLDRIRFLATDDSSFVTPDQVQVGWTRETLELEFKAEVTCERGWACFLALPSGWHAAFRVADEITSGKAIAYRTRMPSEEDAVTWFFRRGACGKDERPGTSLTD